MSTCAFCGSACECSLLTARFHRTVRVWRNGKCIHVLQGHEAAIWAVLAVPGTNLIISGTSLGALNAGVHYASSGCRQDYPHLE